MRQRTPLTLNAMQCQAKSKRSGEQCKGPAVKGLNVCRMHGGKSLAGIASPTLVSGRYSKNLPTRLMGRYQEALQDRELLALRDDLALLDARLEDMLGRVDSGESGEIWRSLLSTVHAMRRAEEKMVACQNTVKEEEWRLAREECIDTIETLAQEGVADYAAWREVKDLLEQRRKVSETEQKRLVAMQQMITAEQAALMQAQVLDIIRRNVTDRTTLSAIAADFGRLAVAGTGRPA